MQIDIRSSSLHLSNEHYERIANRARFAMARLGDQIRRIEVRLADINGPRGGIDKRCRVLVYLNRGEPMLVEAQGSQLAELIDRTFGRTGQAVRKRLGFLTRARYPARKLHGLLFAQPE
jgi:putative sigma-54 modulation protein